MKKNITVDKKKGKFLPICIFAVCFIAFIYCGARLGIYFYELHTDNEAMDDVYRLKALSEQAADITENVTDVQESSRVGITDTDMTNEADSQSVTTQPLKSDFNKLSENGMLIRFEKMYQENNDFAGWIIIGGTVINYPVMGNGAAKDYYLHRNFFKDYSYSGIPFLDKECNIADFKDEKAVNLIIYGHNMKNGSMFHELVDYTDKDFAESHEEIVFDSIWDPGTYRLVAVLQIAFSGSDANNTERFYRFTSTSDETEVSWINSYIQKYAVYASGYKIKAKDSLITLSTCSYQQDDGRTVLIAVRTQQ
jgi:sortase B